MFLVDTNVWLEGLLNQENATEVRRFLDEVPNSRLFVTDFAVFSIGILTVGLGRHEVFLEFLRDVFQRGGVRLLRLDVADLESVPNLALKFGLDFDDAYQYTVASKFGLQIVSFDRDFDRTPLGRKRRHEILEEFQRS